MGRPAFFIRTHGCAVRCPWCDSAGTWHKDYVPVTVDRIACDALIAEVLVSHAPMVIITGGEPAHHDLRPLALGLREYGIRVHLETSGAFPIQGDFDWVTLSPKKWKAPLPLNVLLANEFKFIVEQPADIEFYTDMLLRHGLTEPIKTPVWLHPEWGHRADRKVLDAIIEAVKLGAGPHGPVAYRAGWQLHKLFLADSLDNRTKTPVPLGGNVNKGPST